MLLNHSSYGLWYPRKEGYRPGGCIVNLYIFKGTKINGSF